ncbi:MAG: hypothetical protein ABJG47_00415 [Ekhidna sp.]
MNIKFFTISLVLLLAGAKARTNRTPQAEMNAIKGVKTNVSKVNLNECWPFPKTISEADPFVLELEKELMTMRKDG